MFFDETLIGKRVSEAKLLIEQRGSASDSRTPVESATPGGINIAIQARHKRFFNSVRNLFIGDASANRSIQEHLDDGKPESAAYQLDTHVQHVTRVWAFDDKFRPSSRS